MNSWEPWTELWGRGRHPRLPILFVGGIVRSLRFETNESIMQRRLPLLTLRHHSHFEKWDTFIFITPLKKYYAGLMCFFTLSAEIRKFANTNLGRDDKTLSIWRGFMGAVDWKELPNNLYLRGFSVHQGIPLICDMFLNAKWERKYKILFQKLDSTRIYTTCLNWIFNFPMGISPIFTL